MGVREWGIEMSDLDKITPQQIVKLHNLCQSMGRQCVNTENMTQLEAKAWIKKLKDQIKDLEVRYPA